MIQNDTEYARVEQLIDYMSLALRRLSTPFIPVDPLVEARLRAAYEARIPELHAELHDYARRQAQAAHQTRADVEHTPQQRRIFASLAQAQQHIYVTEHTLVELQQHIVRLTHVDPIDYKEVHAIHEDIVMHAALMSEWQSILNQLVAELDAEISPQ